MKRLPTEQRRKQIAEAALRIITERGLRSFTIAALSEEVGLADGTIFRHFTDKDDIILEAVSQLEETLVGQETQSDGDLLDSLDSLASLDPLDKLGAFLRRRVALIYARPEIFKALFSDDLAKAGPEEAGERVRALKHRSMQFVRAHLEQAIDQGLVRDGYTADELLYLVHGTALALVFSGEDLAEVTQEAVAPADVWQCVERLLRAS